MTWCGWAWPYVQPVRDGVVLPDLDPGDQRIGNAIKAIEHELVRHQVVKMRIPLMFRAPPVARSRRCDSDRWWMAGLHCRAMIRIDIGRSWTNLAEGSAKIAHRVVECGIKRQDGVNSEQPDRPAGGGPFGDDAESH
jgi:hypothetical protein